MSERDILLGASAHADPAARSAFLDAACGGDTALRERVERLLCPDAGDGPTRTLSPGAGDPDFAETRAPDGDGAADVNVAALLSPAQEEGSLGRLDHYEVLGVVGRGGMGVVLRAHDTRLRRVVAVKLLAPALAAVGTARKRFAREAQAAAAVRDEHVVKIHTVCEGASVPYLVMEFVAGVTLEDRVRAEGPLDPSEAVRIGLQSAQGLAAAHAQGLIHRDVKPGNILLEGGTGRVKLTDFGLARAADDASISRSGVIAGTPLYMSPEQAKGDHIDARSDLFSLGSVLYTLLTGKPAFRAESTVAVLGRVCDDAPRPIRESSPGVPRWVCAVVERLMAKDPSERIQTAAEVVDLLGRYLAHAADPDRVPPPPPVRGVRIGGGNRRARAWAIGAAVVSAATVGVLGYLLLAPDPSAAPVPNTARPVEAQPLAGWHLPTAEELAARPSPLDGRTRKQIPPGLLALAGGPNAAPPEPVAILGDSRFRLTRADKNSFMAQDREGKWLAVPNGDTVTLFDSQTGDLVRTLVGSGRMYAVAFSPDGRFLAGASVEGNLGDNTRAPGIVRVWDLAGAEPTVLRTIRTSFVLFVAFNPDGQRLVTAGSEAVRVWNLKTGDEALTIDGQGGQGFWLPAVSPDGKKIAWGNPAEKAVKVHHLETGEVLATLAGHSASVHAAAWSADGKTLATGSATELFVWGTERFEPVKKIDTPATWVAFHPDGKTLLTADHDRYHSVDKTHVVTRWDLGTYQGKRLPTLGTRPGWVSYHLSRDGKTLYSVIAHVTPDHEPDTRVRAFAAATGEELFPGDGRAGQVWTIAVSPDGRTVASGGEGGAVRLWDLGAWPAGAAQPPARAITGHTATVYSVAFSPDGKLLASASKDGAIRLWDGTTGRAVRTLEIEKDGQATDVAFSADGKLLATGAKDGSVRVWDVATGEDLSPLRWHTGHVCSVAFSPDNRFLASAGYVDRKVHVTDLKTMQLVHTAEGRRAEDTDTRVAFAADGRTLAYGGWDDAVRLWDVIDRKETVLTAGIRTLQGLAVDPLGRFVAASGHGGLTFCDRGAPGRALALPPDGFGGLPRHVAFTPEGRYLVVAGFNGTVSILRAPTPPPPYDPGPPRNLPAPDELAKRPSPFDSIDQGTLPPGAAAVLGDDRFRLPQEGLNSEMRQDREGKWLAVPNGDAVALFDARTGQVVRTLKGHDDRVHAVAFSPDGRHVAAGNLARDATTHTILIWERETGKEVARLRGDSAMFWSLAYSPDGKQLFAMSKKGMDVWDLAAGRVARTFPTTPDIWGCYAIGFSPDGKRVAWGAAPNVVKVWEIGTDGPPATLDGHTSWVSYSVFSADGKWFASGSSKELILRDAKTLEVVKTIDTLALWVAFEPGDKTLLTAGYDYVVTRWDLSTFAGKPLPPLNGPGGVVNYHLSADGKTLFVNVADDLVSRGERSVRTYDALTGTRLSQGHAGQVWAVATGPDGRRFASAGKDGTVRGWEVPSAKPGGVATTGRQLWSVARPGNAFAVAFAPDGKTVAAHWRTGALALLDAATGAEVRQLAAVGDFHQITFSPDGGLLAGSGMDGEVRVWEVPSGRLRRTFRVDTAPAFAPVFSPDGRVLAAGSASGRAFLWDVASGWRVGTTAQQDGPVRWIGFRPDGRSVAVAGKWTSGTLRPEDPKFTVPGSNPTISAPSNVYHLHLAAGRKYKFTLTARDPDLVPLLAVDSRPGSDPRVERSVTRDGTRRAVVEITPTENGLHRVIACAESGQGRYQLMMEAEGVSEPVGPSDVLVFDLASLNETHRLAGHESGVVAGAWRADGRVLVTAGETDGTLRLWDFAQTPPAVRTLRPLPPGTRYLFGLALTPEGRYAAVAGPDGAIPVFRIPDGAPPYDPGPPRPVPDPKELAARPAAADALKREDIPAFELKRLGDGDPDRVPPEVVAVLGDGRFALPRRGQNAFLAQDRAGKWLAVPNADSFALFDARTGERVRVLTDGGRAFGVAFSPDGKLLATATNNLPKGDNKALKVWEVQTGTVVKKFDSASDWIRSLAYHPGGKYVLACGLKSVEVCDVDTGTVVRTLDGGDLWQLGVSPDGKWVAVGGPGRHTARVYDVESGEAVANLDGLSDDARATEFSTDGKLLAVGNDRELLIWNTATWELVKRLDTPAGWVAFEPGGKTVLTAGHDQRGRETHVVTRWDLTTFAGKPLAPLNQAEGWTAFYLSPNGEILYSLLADDPRRQHYTQRVRTYDAATGNPVAPVRAPAAQLNSVAFSPDGKRLAAVNAARGLWLWDAATGKLDRVFEEARGSFSVAFSPDSTLLATGENLGSVSLFDVATGAKVRTLPGPTTDVRSVAFSPDGRWVAGTTMRGAVNVWEVATGRLRHSLSGRSAAAWSVAFSPDGRTVATGWAGGTILLFDATTGWEVAALSVGSLEVRWIGFHPDGRSLAVAGVWEENGQNLCVWDLAAGKVVRRMPVPGAAYTAAVGRADGQLLAACSAFEGAVRLWTSDGLPERHRAIRLYPQGVEWLHGLAMSPEGRYLATANPDGTIIVLRLTPAPAPYAPNPVRAAPDPKELAARPAAADALKREDIPPHLLKLAGRGEPDRVPPEVVAVLGNSRFPLPKAGPHSWMAQDREGKFLAVPNHDQVALFDPRTGELVRTFAATGRVFAAAFSPDGKFLAAGVRGGKDKAKAGTVRVWEVETGELKKALTGEFGWVVSLAFTPNGKRVIGHCEEGVHVWDWTEGQARDIAGGGDVFQLAVGADGKTLVGRDPDKTGLRVLDLDTGNVLKTLGGAAERIRSTAFSPDGSLLVGGSDKELMVWDAKTWKLLKRLETPAGWVAFEPGGKTVLAAKYDQSGANPEHVVTRWDLTTFKGTPLTSLGNRSGWTVYQLSPDGKTLYSLVIDGRDIDRTVRAHDAATGKPLHPAQAGQIWGVAFSPDGKRIASVSSDPGVWLWDAATGKVERVLPGEGGYWSVAFSPDGKTVAAGGWSNGSVALWDAATGEKRRTLAGLPSEVRAVAFSPDGALVAGTTSVGAVHVWEVATGRLRHVLRGRQETNRYSWCLAFSDDGKTLATGWSQGDVTLFDVAVGWEVAQLQTALGEVRWLGFHRDGRSLGVVGNTRGAAGSGPGTSSVFGVWDVTTRKLVRRMEVAHSAYGPSGGAWRADGLVLASLGSDDGTVRLWSTDGTPERDQVIRLGPPGTEWLHGLAMSPEGRHLAVANPDGTVTVLRLAKPGEVFEPKSPPLLKALAGHTSPVVSVAYSPDGRLIASGDDTGVRIWDAAAGVVRHVLSAPNSGAKTYTALTFSPDGKFVLAALSALPNTTKNPIAVWDAATGKPAGTLEGHSGAVWSIAFSPDGKALVSAGNDATIRWWDFEKRSELRSAPAPTGQFVRSVAAAASGHLGVGSGNKVSILDPDGAALHTIDRAAAPMVLSPDGRLLAAVSWTEGRVTVWDRATGKEVAAWKAHNGFANGLAFAPGGRVLATTGSDRAVRLWDVTTGRQLAELTHDGAYALVFSPDGAALTTTGTRDRQVKVWDVSGVLRAPYGPGGSRD